MDSRHPAHARSGAPLHLVPGTGSRTTAGRGSGGAPVAGAGAGVEQAPAPRSFRRYPLWRVLGLNGLTVAHYLVGCGAILVAYRHYPLLGWPVGLAYLVFAMVQLYVLMPLVVCPGCVYRTMRGGRCASGLNLDLGAALPALAGRGRL